MVASFIMIFTFQFEVKKTCVFSAWCVWKQTVSFFILLSYCRVFGYVCSMNGISFSFSPFWLFDYFLHLFLNIYFSQSCVCVVTGDNFQACKKYLLFNTRSKSNIWHEIFCTMNRVTKKSVYNTFLFFIFYFLCCA